MFGSETRTAAQTDALERFCLARLDRFVQIAIAADGATVGPWRRLARHATFAAYQDCLALGLERQAQAILER
jgi:hypothetical protein